VLGSIILLVVLLFLFINSKWGQDIIRDKAVAFLKDKLKTEVQVGELRLSLPYWIELKDVLVMDRAHDTLASIGRLRVDIAMLKLISGEIEIENLELENTYANLYRNYPDTTFNFDFIAQSFSSNSPKEPKAKKDTTTTIDIDVEKIAFKNIRFNFLDYSGGVQFRIALDTLGLKGRKTDISKLVFTVDDVLIAGVNSSVKIDTSIIPPSGDTTSGALPVIYAGRLQLKDINFSFDDLQQPHQEEGIDYVHLDLKDVALDAENAYYTLDSTSGIINHLAAKEKSGVDLRKFKSSFAYYAHGAYLHDLYLETANSIVRDNLEIRYSSIKSLKEQLGEMELHINLGKTVVGVKDILIFAPDLRSQELFRQNSNEQLQLTTAINGKLKSLNIDDFYLSGLDGTVVNMSGQLNGLPDANKINYDFLIAEIRSTEKDIMAFIPEDVVASVDLPEHFSLTGQISGTTLDYNPDIALVSTDGSATVKGYLHMSGGEGNEKYKLYVTTDKLNIGKILRQDSVLGRITANISAEGSSFDIKRMNTVLKGDISSLWAIGYNYSNIRVDGSIQQQQAVLALLSADPNADFNLDAAADLSGEYPTLTGRLEADSINLYALKLAGEELALTTNIDFNFPYLNPDYPYGDVVISATGVYTKDDRYFMDTLLVSAKSSPDTGQHIDINADFIFASITGNIPLTKSGALIQQQINKYNPLQARDTTAPDTSESSMAGYTLALDATITDRPLLRTLLPSLEYLQPTTLQASISQDSLNVYASIPGLGYSDMLVDSAVLTINNTSPHRIAYNLSLQSFSQGTTQLWYPNISGGMDSSNITARAVVKDLEKKDRYVVNAMLDMDSNQQTISLQEGLMLNYRNWTVSPGNKIVIDDSGLYADNFKLSHNDGAIALQSERQEPNAPLDITIKNFLISDIVQVIQQDSLVANGLLNSNIKVTNLSGNIAATGKLTVDHLSITGDTIGDLHVDLLEASANEIDTRITLNGNGNDLVITGSYYPEPQNGNNFDLQMDVHSLNMQTAEGLAAGQLRNSSGKLSGDIDITGTIEQPKLNGELRTDQVKTTIVQLGAAFTMRNEVISFSGDKISFNNFTLEDNTGNTGILNGDVSIKSLSKPSLDINFKADHWQVLNSTSRQNDLFYGELFISSNIDITGPAAAPSVEGLLTIHDSTDFTINIPEDEPGVEEREGVIEFVDKSAPEGFQRPVKKDESEAMAIQTGADLNLNIAIEDDARFNVVIDPASGDMLSVKGEANLNTQINPDGTIGLAGVYTLKDGFYELNYSLVKRKFKIKEGSEIKFAGDPLKAEVDITAEYTANIPPYELVQNEIDEQNSIYYKQRLPFSVVLKLSGEILEPEVAFDITLPTEKNYRANSEVIPIVQGKLQQMRNNPSEMNKQVFAALVLNKFIASDPLESMGGTSTEYVVRQSASRFLSAQLNRLSDELVKGLDVNVDLQSTEDYTTGAKRNRTDLNLSATKQLFDERLSVTVGNNFELEGAEEGNNNNSNLIPGNLAVDYKLSTDGRYLIRIFRRRDNINIVEGVSVETGVSFVITLDYNRFRNIFRGKKREQEEAEKEKTDESQGTY
jgi:translocation and assembly module TamB